MNKFSSTYSQDSYFTNVTAGLDVEDEESAVRADKSTSKQWLGVLSHVPECQDVNCHVKDCNKMKRAIQHSQICQHKTKKDCQVCQHLIALCCIHAVHCQTRESENCTVPFCTTIKARLMQREGQKNVYQVHICYL